MKKAGLLLGGVALLLAMIPMFYGVLHIGVWVLLLAGVALCALALLWHRLGVGTRRCAGIVLTIALLGFAAVSAAMVRQAWFHTPPENANLPIIVLGGRVRADGPSLSVAYRLDAAAAYLQRNPQAICVVSGGQGADEPLPEALVMARYLTDKHGIDPTRIRQEDRSTNTQENIRFSKEFLDGQQRIVLATNSFHQLRASMLAAREGLDAYSVSAATPPGLFPSYWVRDLLGVLFTAAGF